MLKSNNFDSIMDDLSAFSGTDNIEALRPTTLELEPTPSGQITLPSVAEQLTTQNTNDTEANNNNNNNGQFTSASLSTVEPSLSSLQLTAGLLQSFAPPIAKARCQLKELIGKQNKIYIDLSAEKFRLDNSEVAKLQEMMVDVKVYREKLIKIKKQMQNIYQRTKTLKKRALHIQTCKEKEHQRKLQKQQHEESLIGKPQ